MVKKRLLMEVVGFRTKPRLPATTAPAPVEKPVEAKPAQPVVKKVVKTVKPAPKDDDDDFDGLFDMIKKR